MTRTASCSCGQLSIEVEGELLGVGICHCLACQKRTGRVMVAVGAFADPKFPPPQDSIYTVRKHPWVQLPPGIVTDADPA